MKMFVVRPWQLRLFSPTLWWVPNDQNSPKGSKPPQSKILKIKIGLFAILIHILYPFVSYDHV